MKTMKTRTFCKKDLFSIFRSNTMLKSVCKATSTNFRLALLVINLTCLMYLISCGGLPPQTQRQNVKKSAALVPDPLQRVKKSAALVPDPLDVSGDELYAIYRKGVITRHITKNGRFLYEVGLESLDDFDVTKDFDDDFVTVYRKEACKILESGCERHYQNDGAIKLYRKVPVHHIPKDNVRYSEELVSGDSGWESQKAPYNSAPIMWVPVIAPVKDPGYSNDGYYVVSSKGDNPLYYGGLALATLSLESIHNVGSNSICYARRLAEYILSSELTNRNGYLIRLPAFFSSNRNRKGEPVIQGASAEELLGFFIGSMYYLRAEEKNECTTCDRPSMADEITALRHRVLSSLPSVTWWQCTFPSGGDYKHPLMISRINSSYQVGHFKFPYFASANIYLTGPPESSCQPMEAFLSLADASVGHSQKFGEWFKDMPFDFHMMFLTSTVLVLDSDIPKAAKQSYAKSFMKEYVRAAVTSGNDKESLKYNAYLGVVALLLNKYLPGNKSNDSDFHGAIWKEIWSKDEERWNDLMTAVRLYIENPKSIMNKEWPFNTTSNLYQWQHNLPLMTPETEEKEWKEHNPHQRIGNFFAFKFNNNPEDWRKSKYIYKRSHGDWIGQFPGWTYGLAYADFENGYAKTYKRSSFLTEVLARQHDHHDNQVEGAGLGLLFIRMLLTQINPELYPPPVLPEKHDKALKVLPWPGVEPMHPEALDYIHQKRVTEIGGDRDQSLRIVALGRDTVPGANFVIAYPTNEESLRLAPGFVTDGIGGIDAGIYLNTHPAVGSKFDKVEVVRTSHDGTEYLVTGERAEDGKNHWLRVSLWRISGYSEGDVGTITRLTKWESSEKHLDAVEDLDMVLVGEGNVALILRNRDEKHVLRLFHIDFSTPVIRHVLKKTVSENPYDHYIAVASAYTNVLLYNKQSPDGYRIATEILRDGTFHAADQTALFKDETLFDITTIKRLDYTKPDHASGYYIVAVGKHRYDGYLFVRSWFVSQTGTLLNEKQFNTAKAEEYLLGREFAWQRASVKPVYWKGRSGFVIAGKGVARMAYKNVTVCDYLPSGQIDINSCQTSEKWIGSSPGVKVIYGYIMRDWRPTIESSSVIGSGDSNDGEMVDVTNWISDGDDEPGVVTVHKSSDDRLYAVYWRFRDKFERVRWQTTAAEVQAQALAVKELHADKQIYGGSVTYIEATFENIGASPTTSTSAILTLPKGLTIVRGDNPQNLGALEAEAARTAKASWAVRGEPCPQPKSYTIRVQAQGSFEGGTMKSDAAQRSLMCIPPGNDTKPPDGGQHPTEPK